MSTSSWFYAKNLFFHNTHTFLTLFLFRHAVIPNIWRFDNGKVLHTRTTDFMDEITVKFLFCTAFEYETVSVMPTGLILIPFYKLNF